MKLTAEVVGGTADRFRAYTVEDMTRKPRPHDHRRRAMDGKPSYKPGQRVNYAVEEPSIEGPVKGSSVKIKAGEKRVTNIVFYSGPVEEEAVVGSVNANATGDIEVELVKPADEAEE